jgi:hypothetical protein
MIRQFRRWRRAVRLNVAGSLLLGALLVLLLNGLATHYYWRGPIGGDGRSGPALQTVRVLQGLSQPVEVTVFHQRGAPCREEIDLLLREYLHRSPWLSVEFVDPDRHLARVAELASRYTLSAAGGLLVRSAERAVFVPAEEYVMAEGAEGRNETHWWFQAERALTAAIYRVTQAAPARVYFLSGHGERRIDDYDRFLGYSTIAARMRADHIEPETLLLGEAGAIPADADALVIAGPDRRIPQPELDLIHAYLEQSGRVMLLIDSMTRTGLESVLAPWGVRLGDDVVMDPARTLTGRELFVSEYGEHLVTAPLHGVVSVFYSPRSVRPLPDLYAAGGEQADRPRVTPLAASSPSGWTEWDSDRTPTRAARMTDRHGPVPIAVAVERGPVPGLEVRIRPTRMVVIGDSGFVSNGALTGGDEDFFMSALSWLLDRDTGLAIAPRPLETVRLSLHRRELLRLSGWVVLGWPLAVVLLGWWVWVARRH